MKNFRFMMDRLTGPAFQFGQGNLLVKAREFEAYLDSFIEHSLLPRENEWENIQWYVDSRRFELEDAVEVEELHEVDDALGLIDNIQPGRAGDFESTLYFYGVASEAEAELKGQLRSCGFPVETLAVESNLKELLDASRSRIVFIHTLQFRRDPRLLDILPALKSKNPDGMYLVFLAEQDDFDLRLKTVRAGGDAFFVMPLDIVRLTDKIEGLISRTSRQPYHVLIVDDDHEQLAHYALVLQKAGMITSVATDPRQVMRILVESRPDLILMDIYMKGCGGMELTRLLRQHEAHTTIPVVFLTCDASMERRLQAIREGGDDFLTKPIKADSLVSVVRMRAERYRSLRYHMERDSLTGLLNHSNLKEHLKREIIRSERSGMPLSFAMIDADFFKSVNDTYGHLTGDRVLKSLARMLQDRLRRTDIIGRYGGEEFGVVLLNTNAEESLRIIDEIRRNFAAVMHRSGEKEFRVTFSCGIASYPDCTNPKAIARIADDALYAAKKGGRNRVVHATRSVHC